MKKTLNFGYKQDSRFCETQIFILLVENMGAQKKKEKKIKKLKNKKSQLFYCLIYKLLNK